MSHKIESIDVVESIHPEWHGLEKRREKITVGDCWLSTWDVTPSPLYLAPGEVTPEIAAKIAAIWKKIGISNVEKAAEIARLFACNPLPNKAILTTEADGKLITLGQSYDPRSYCPVSNQKFLELVEKSMKGENFSIATCGSVKGRARTFISVEIPEKVKEFSVAGCEYRPYLTFLNSFDKSSTLMTGLTVNRPCCDNTYRFCAHEIETNVETGATLAESHRHTKKLLNWGAIKDNLVKKVSESIGAIAEFRATLESFSKIEIADETARAQIAGLIGTERVTTRLAGRVARIHELSREGAGNRGESLLDIWEGVTDYYSHESSANPLKIRAGEVESIEKQRLSSEFGSGAIAKQRIFGILSNPSKREAALVRGRAMLPEIDAALKN